MLLAYMLMYVHYVITLTASILQFSKSAISVLSERWFLPSLELLLIENCTVRRIIWFLLLLLLLMMLLLLLILASASLSAPASVSSFALADRTTFNLRIGKFFKWFRLMRIPLLGGDFGRPFVDIVMLLVIVLVWFWFGTSRLKPSKCVRRTLGSSDSGNDWGNFGVEDDNGAALFNVIGCMRFEAVVVVDVVVVVAAAVAGFTSPLSRNGKSIFLILPAGMCWTVFIWLNALLFKTTKLPDRDSGVGARSGCVDWPFARWIPRPLASLPFCCPIIVSLPARKYL